jgi:hypothetical protein
MNYKASNFTQVRGNHQKIFSLVLALCYVIGLLVTLLSSVYRLWPNENPPEYLTAIYDDSQLLKSDFIQSFPLGLPGFNLSASKWFDVDGSMASTYLMFLPPILLGLFFCYVFIKIINRLNVKALLVFAGSFAIFWFFARYFAVYSALISLAQRVTEADAFGRETITMFAFTPEVMFLSFLNYAVTFGFVGFWSWFAFWRKSKA